MSVTYRVIDSEFVSKEWYLFLTNARKAGVVFRVNEGHRTFARQWYFYNNQPPLAAYPSNTAPHIRTGRIDHALDLNNSQAVINYGAQHGIHMRRTVRGETWHVEAPAAELIAYWHKHFAPPDPLRLLTPRERRLVKELAFERRIAKRHGGWEAIDPWHLKRATEVETWLKAQNSRIHDAAKKTGWDREHRRERHKILHSYIT